MVSPKVSVLMTVYNGEQFLREAVESILCQTFKDFEFIVINDGSKDKTREILKSFNDPRIRLIHQDNRGVTATLNIGIDLVRGQYIARMDCDDISQPERLAKQVAWLESCPDHCAVATKIIYIDSHGNQTKGGWEIEELATTSDEIRKSLPIDNCIVHPTVMIRTAVIKKYRYNPTQKYSQDYDLWMRLVADGLKIGKLKERFLKLRIHNKSISAVSERAFGECKIIYIKGRYLRLRIFGLKRFNWFDFCVFIEFMRKIISVYMIGKIRSILSGSQ